MIFSPLKYQGGPGTGMRMGLACSYITMQLPFVSRYFWRNTWSGVIVVPAIPQSEVLGRFLQEIGENAEKFWRSFSQVFVLQFPKENGRKSVHKISSTLQFHSAPKKVFFFHSCNSGGLWGTQVHGTPLTQATQPLVKEPCRERSMGHSQ